MKKALALTFVTFAITALVTSMISIGTLQTAAASNGKSDDAYGNKIIKPNAQCGKSDSCTGDDENWGDSVSEAARDDSGRGIGDWRSDGCKITQDRSDC
jgi:hypothetical protein